MPYIIGFLYVFFSTDYSILHKLIELCLFMQTILPHENHVESFFLTYTQSPE